MKATCVEELLVYQKALAAAAEVSRILKRQCFQQDRRLFDQLSASTDAVPSLMSEGFGQSSDRQFAQSLYKSRSESNETRTHLTIAKDRDDRSYSPSATRGPAVQRLVATPDYRLSLRRRPGVDLRLLSRIWEE